MFFLNHSNHSQRFREIESLRLRSEWLSTEDKTLMQMVFEKGSTFQQIARLTGQSPSTVSRRFHRLVHRLIDRKPASLQDRHVCLNRADIRIIQDYFLRGQSQKDIAQKRNTSLYRVRSILRTIRSITSGDSHSSSEADPKVSAIIRSHKTKRKTLTRKRSTPCTH